MNHKQRRRHKARKNMMFGFFGAVFFVIMVFGLILYIKRYAPTKEHLALSEYYPLEHEDEAVVIVDGVTEEKEGSYGGGRIVEGVAYIELSVLKDMVDNAYVYDSKEEILRYATDVSVITTHLGSNTYTEDKEEKSVSAPIIVSAYDKIYIAAEFVQLYSDMQYQIYDKAPMRIVIENAGYEHTVATLRSNAAIRKLGGSKSKILKDAKKGEKVIVYDTVGKWTRVLSEDGISGYVKRGKLKKKETVVTKSVLPERQYAHHFMDKEVCLGWLQTSTVDGNATFAKILSTVGKINVVSPTWYYLDDNIGGIASKASPVFVQEAHASGKQVWALFSNFENPNVDTTTVLNTTSYRDRLEDNLISAAIATGVDGINIDIELLKEAAADGYAAFIRELSIKCEQNNLILSVDVAPPETWNVYYDRENLGKYCDYVIIMAYDEHYGGGEEAGSTASLPYVRKAVENSLKEVPTEQLVLGIPFYSRLWEESPTDLTTKAIHMEDIPGYLAEHGLETVWKEKEEQNYAEYTEGDLKHMIWIEDATSMAERMVVMDENKLAGCAFWKLGNEPQSIWNVIDEYID